MTRLVTEGEVAELLTPAAAYAAVEASFLRLARGEVDNPPRVRTTVHGGQFAVMPCVDRGLGLAGLKAYVWTPGATPFVVVLIRIEPAELVAVVEADLLGRLRTAAASAVAATHLARRGAESLGVLGCGRQAASHVTALRAALPSLRRVVAYCRDGAALQAFCTEHDCDAAARPEVAGACDVVVVATTSVTPVLQGSWISEGAVVIAVGANDPAARELDDGVIGRASFVCVDSREQAREEAGDVIAAVRAGTVGWEDVHELQDVVAGTRPGRGSEDDIVVFKSSGLAAWDLAAAASVAL